MIRTSLIAVAALSATAAMADGPQPVITPPIIAPASDWSGFYGGLSYGTGKAKGTNGNVSNSVDATSRGLFVGYNHDMGQYVIGGELAYDQWKPEGGSFDDTKNLRLLGRVGYDAGRVLPYLTAGFASVESGGSTESGYAYGVGVDFLATSNVIIGLQYLEQRYENVLDVKGADLDVSGVSLRVSYKF